MPIHIPTHITRLWIKEHRHEYLFIYGDTADHTGDGGQAREARGEINAYPVPTKLRKCYNDPSAFFDDRFYEENKKIIDRHISAIPEQPTKIILFPKLGEGRNEMPTRAIKTYGYLIWSLGAFYHERIINPEKLRSKYNILENWRNQGFPKWFDDIVRPLGY